MNTLNITNKIISYNHQVIQIRNISSIDLKEEIEIRKRKWLWIIIGAYLMLLGFQLFVTMLLIETDSFFITLVSLFPGGLIGVGGFFLLKRNLGRVKRLKNYILKIQTNAGTVQLFTNKDYDFMTGIKSKIQEVLNSEGFMNIVYNMDNKTIINNPTGNISIINPTVYEGLNQEQLDFLTSKFESALQELKAKVEKIDSNSHNRDLQLLLDELRTTKPRKSILNTALQGLVNLKDISEITQVIEQGINMF